MKLVSSFNLRHKKVKRHTNCKITSTVYCNLTPKYNLKNILFLFDLKNAVTTFNFHKFYTHVI